MNSLFSLKEIIEFRNYVLSFYAYDGIYPINGLTVSIVESAIENLINQYDEFGINFYGDTIDRERVRDIILADK